MRFKNYLTEDKVNEGINAWPHRPRQFNPDKDKVKYSPIKSPKKPFQYKGKWYTRDEMKKMGLDKEASKVITEAKTYTDEDWVLVQNDTHEVLKYIKNPKNDKAPSKAFTSSKNQDLFRISKAKQLGTIKLDKNKLS